MSRFCRGLASQIVILFAAGLLAAPALANDEPRTGAIALADDLFKDASRVAARLAASHYSPPADDLPAVFRDLDYDGFRKLRPRPETMVWGETGNAFAALPLPRGGIYHAPVALHFVAASGDITTRSVADFIDFIDYPQASDAERDDLGMSGWRAITRPGIAGEGYEFAVFQGASYFRAVGAGGVYGVSARALAIDTGSSAGEEFPRFTDFWIFEPQTDDANLSVIALADSPSAASAYRFTLTPGATAVIDVQADIHPRTDIAEAGLAPLSSMFLHAPADPHARMDDRPEVHDSDGLAIVLANGERIWRPLANPAHVQVSEFTGAPAGFGLQQRQRAPDAYADAEAQYERRPDVWIEPQGDWGSGSVRLLEIPTADEYADNIAAFWRPADAWRAGEVQSFAYRLHWASHVQAPATGRVVATQVAELAAVDAASETAAQRFTISFSGDTDLAATALRPDVWSTGGAISNISLTTEAGGIARLTFDLDPGAEQQIELHAALTDEFHQQTETWLFRWTPE